MVRIRVKTRVGPDGTLNIQVPAELRETDLEVLVVLNPIQISATGPSRESGWPEGYFETTFGSFRDDRLTRPPQGRPEAREPLQ
jgi:hypothetical protein